MFCSLFTHAAPLHGASHCCNYGQFEWAPPEGPMPPAARAEVFPRVSSQLRRGQRNLHQVSVARVLNSRVTPLQNAMGACHHAVTSSPSQKGSLVRPQNMRMLTNGITLTFVFIFNLWNVKCSL
eukprot:3365815-Amphidinium_carterae.2